MVVFAATAIAATVVVVLSCERCELAIQCCAETVTRWTWTRIVDSVAGEVVDAGRCIG